MKVLVVTQDARVSLQVTTALVGDGEVRMLEVRTPQRALQQIDEVGGFDLVVADADTVPTGGFALAREIKARKRMGREVPPIVLLIARVQDTFLSKWSEADAFVLKPADPFNLHAVLLAVAAGDDVPALPGVGAPAGSPQALGVPEAGRGSPITGPG